MSDARLMAPLLLWLAGYCACCWFFVPRMGRLSEIQSDMRSLVTGRIVDSYTNILTVKLFARPRDEDAYVRKTSAMCVAKVYEINPVRVE